MKDIFRVPNFKGLLGETVIKDQIKSYFNLLKLNISKSPGNKKNQKKLNWTLWRRVDNYDIVPCKIIISNAKPYRALLVLHATLENALQ
jgi:hypothetical protein